MIKTCPISKTLVDENSVRLNGFFTIVFLVLSYFNIIFAWMLLMEFLLKIINIKFAPIATISKTIMHSILKKKPIPTDYAPKRFAMMIGFLMNIILIIFYYFKMFFAFKILLIIFILAASGESFLNYCVGCAIYSLFLTIKQKINK